jgi:ATP:ADP antiporter, AAA family
MIEFVEKALNVRRSELGPASLLSLYLFLIIGCYIMGQSIGKAMFLKVYPTGLPVAMMGTSIVVGIFATTYIRLSHRIRVEWMMIGSLLFFATCFAGSWWLTHFPGRLVYGFIYAWVFLTGAMGPTMGWTIANYVLTTREARRVFGFIGAGACLGAPVAGFTTASLLHNFHLRPQTLLLLVAGSLVLCSVIVRALYRQGKERIAEANVKPAADPEIPRGFIEIFNYIRRSRYLVLITALITVGCTATMIVTYQFDMIAKAHFGADTARLATFFGNYNGFMGIATFLVQMFLTGHLLRKLGIRITLFVLPVIFVGGTIAVFLAPVLLTAIFLKGTHNLLRFSVDKSSAELLYLPVAPPRIKNQIKSFIDGFMWRVADGIAGLALYLFANILGFSPGRIGLVNMVFLAGWIAIAYGVRREYLNVLRRAIERRTLDPDRIATEVLDSTTTQVLAMSLERGGEQEVMYGLSLLEVGREPGWHPALRGLLDHASPSVRQRALQLLGDAGDKKIQPKVEKMLGDDSPEVRAEALHYLVAHSGRDPLTLMTADTNLPDYVVQAAVVTYLAKTDQADNRAAGQVIFETMLAAAGPGAVRSRIEAARVLGVVPADSELQSHLLPLLGDEDTAVQEQAVLAAGKTQNRDALHPIIERLGNPQLLAAARAALAEYGERALGTLQDHLNDPSVAMSVRKQIPKVLARIATPQAAAVLSNCLLQNDPGLRFELLKALNKMRSLESSLVPPDAQFEDMLNAELMGYYRSFQILAAIDPQGSTSLDGSARPSTWDLLPRALRERMDHELERIFRLLGLLYPPRDIHNAYAGLISGQARIRSNAMEVLEHLVRSDLYKTLVCALDPDVSLKDKLQFAQRLCHTSVESESEAVRVALHSEDRWLRACAIFSIGEKQMLELNEELRRVPHADDPLLDETWNWASARLEASAPA